MNSVAFAITIYVHHICVLRKTSPRHYMLIFPNYFVANLCLYMYVCMHYMLIQVVCNRVQCYVEFGVPNFLC